MNHYERKIYEVMKGLTEADKFYARDPEGEKISVFTDKDNYEKAVKGGYDAVDAAEAEAELAGAEPAEKPEPKATAISADPFADKDGEEPSDSPEARLAKIDSEIEDIEDQRRILKQYTTSSGGGGVSRSRRDQLEKEDKELLAKWRELQMAKMDTEDEIDAKGEQEESPEDRLEKVDKEIEDIEDQRRILKQYMTSSGMGGVSRSRRDQLEKEDKELVAKWRELQQARDDIQDEIDTKGEQEESIKVINGKKYRAIRESVDKRISVKEVHKWLKGLEEYRYRKIPGVDARRITSFVNNGLNETDLPISLQKKWGNATYSKEKTLADRFMKERINRKLTQTESKHPLKEQYDRLFKNKVVL